ncbi:MAG: tRNA (N6-isopentenyl adenosine(37)-C2)-methylthiotransferase MiaB [Bacteroidales bacterium]|jgi:tRNA-2-methylthio-N6-dimethylallyladenosine synthase|nr:tRNA (N6-isopentenyl adenosine(37)-C2)-methylthiotransferase MiaB [Bacteroidales bacterium]
MKKLYIETYGCQMNVADSEVVAAILSEEYTLTNTMQEADLLLINTCSVRDHAEQRVRARLRELAALKKGNASLLIGLLGCMAERVKEALLNEEEALDFIAGPDAYRTLPQLISRAQNRENPFNVLLSTQETYDDILPIRYDTNGVSAFISITRGCNNFCTYCVVPYTRGRERSRPPETILHEVEDLANNGYKELTLLGQNVNSYSWRNDKENMDFPDLIAAVASHVPHIRVRFATSHPKDISDKLLHTIARYPNICKHIHLPVQSGSDNMLNRMNRGYSREKYLQRVARIKELLPHCTLSTDIITGFCGETEKDHQDTLTLMETVGYASAFLFKYSVREGTLAAKKFTDDIPENVKARRFNEILTLQQQLSLNSNLKEVGKTVEVLVEGTSKRSNKQLFGRTSQNKVVVFDGGDRQPGDLVLVTIHRCTAATLIGK